MLYASRVALPIAIARVGEEYVWNKTDSGTILACFFWGYAVTQVFAGGFADSHGGEKILPISSIVWVLITFFTPQLFDFAYACGFPLFVLLTVRILMGVAQGFHMPCMASMVARHLTSNDKGRVFGFCLAGSHVGTVLAGLIGSTLLDWYGWRSLFRFAGLASAVWLWSFHVLMTRAAQRRGVSDSLSEELLRRSDKLEANEKVIVSPNLAVPWSVLLSHPAFWAAAVAQYCGGNAYFMMFNWLPSFFHEKFPAEKGVVYNVVPSLAIVITSMIAPFMATRLLTKGYSVTLTRRLMEGASLAGLTLCLFLVPLTHTFPAALFAFTLAMAARGLHHGGVSVNPHDFAPHHTGSVFGIFNAFGAITGFIGVYVAGQILEASGNNWTYVFLITAVQCIIGAAVYCSLGTGNKII